MPTDLSHVDLTGYPVTEWKYMINAATLGRSYALYAANVAFLVLLGILGRFDSPGCNDIRQSLGFVASRQPVIISVPCFSCMMTATRVKVTAQSASHLVCSYWVMAESRH